MKSLLLTLAILAIALTATAPRLTAATETPATSPSPEAATTEAPLGKKNVVLVFEGKDGGIPIKVDAAVCIGAGFKQNRDTFNIQLLTTDAGEGRCLVEYSYTRIINRTTENGIRTSESQGVQGTIIADMNKRVDLVKADALQLTLTIKPE
ncbi:hypothetical protein [Geminisphaera colitermitum]|uniref:hypothetical protein n=1 Tax=Geminisphaera colitermitum TaxID=1148786 RepID=UPI00019652FE|nr:hypothetical protein [Geminisphaera colitermitum]